MRPLHPTEKLYEFFLRYFGGDVHDGVGDLAVDDVERTRDSNAIE
jgi:hypothetical protein